MVHNSFKLMPGVYAYVGDLPVGCKLCMQGVKMVIFITGLCSERCFYCPVSPQRLYHDKVFADEEEAHRLSDFVEEVYRIAAAGASITGGDPLVRLERTVRTIRLLKDMFGPSFHIHLYTSGRYATRDALIELEKAGLDEIRFHPVEQWMLRRIENAVSILKYTRVGVEVPVFPDKVEQLKQLIATLDRLGVDFINLNEAEVSERNIRQVLSRGYHVNARKPVVEGSEEAALQLVRWASEHGLRITVHYCPASYKDAVQLRTRLLRKALRIRRPYEKVTWDGMLESAEVPINTVPPQLREHVEIRGNIATLHPGAASGLKEARIRRRYPSVFRASALPVNIERVT